MILNHKAAIELLVKESSGDIGINAFTLFNLHSLLSENLVADPEAFEDVNKRVSRLAANIPLIQADLCPLSFVDVPERAYISGTLGVYEMTRTELLRDVFVWAYERSCQKYVVIRDSVAEPDLFRMRYRNALIDVGGEIVRERKRPTEDEIHALAERLVEPHDVPRFVELVTQDFRRINEGNFARYGCRLKD